MIQIEEKIRKSGPVYVFIDEAQKADIEDLANVLSYFYDRFPNIFFVISGSEIGLNLLWGLLEGASDETESPLSSKVKKKSQQAGGSRNRGASDETESPLSIYCNIFPLPIRLLLLLIVCALQVLGPDNLPKVHLAVLLL